VLGLKDVIEVVDKKIYFIAELSCYIKNIFFT
jgi:hypothetical protein